MILDFDEALKLGIRNVNIQLFNMEKNSEFVYQCSMLDSLFGL